MLENLSQENKEKLILNQEALERVQQEQLQNQETSSEAIQKKIQEEIQKIEEYSEQITDIPEYQEKQITDLGGNPAIIDEKLKPEFNLLKSIRENVGGRFTRIIGTLGLISGLNNTKAEDGITIKPFKIDPLEKNDPTEKILNEIRFVNPEDYGNEQYQIELRSHQEYLSNLWDMKQDSAHYADNKATERFNYLSTIEGKQAYLKEVQEEKDWRESRLQDAMSNGYSADYIKHEQQELDRINILLNEIENNTWKPSLDLLHQNYQKELDAVIENAAYNGYEPNLDGAEKYIVNLLEGVKNDAVDWAKKSQEAYKVYDKQLEWMNANISSPAYIAKAKKFEGLTSDEIRKRLQRINKRDYEVGASMATSNAGDSKVRLQNLEQGQATEHNNNLTGIHEFTHESTSGKNNMSQYALDLYQKAFDMEGFLKTKQKFWQPDGTMFFGNEHTKIDAIYMANPTEMDARKKVTEYFMEQQNIKRYDEKFTKEHYQKLLELKKQNKLPSDIDQFLDIIKPEYIEQIMNTIADVSTNDQESINKVNQA